MSEESVVTTDYMPSVGDSFRLYYNEDNRNNKLIHIRAIVDGEYIIYRYWNHGNWIYRMTDPTFFFVNINSGTAKKVKSGAEGRA